PLLMTAAYLPSLTQNKIAWGFFSGAMRDEAFYVLRRLGVDQPPLVAMEDAPGKPDPTGLMQVVQAISTEPRPVIYAGDTVADMVTITRAKAAYPNRQWAAVGVLPPHVQQDADYRDRYSQTLSQAGADVVVASVEALDVSQVKALI
ncbi:MAG: HAD-IA family hydrolase, partial [Cyanobacteria bacterium J06632_22]